MVKLVQKEDAPLPEAKTPREEVIAQITQRDRAERDAVEPEPTEETEETQETTATDESELVPDGEAEESVDQEEEVDGGEPVPGDDETPEEDFVTVKIDGVETQVKRDKILDAGVRTFQKESAADKRLQEASVQLKKLQQFEHELRQREEALATALPSKDEPKQSETDQQVYRKTAEALYSGDEEAAAEALRALLEGREQAKPATPAAPQVDQEALVQEVVRQTRYTMSVENARESFASEFTEILADPVLARLANEESAALLETNPDFTPRQNLMEAGTRVRKWVEAHGGEHHTPAPESKKTERKRALKPVKAAGGKTPGEPEVKPKTGSDIVAEMRKQRGLPAD